MTLWSRMVVRVVVPSVTCCALVACGGGTGANGPSGDAGEDTKARASDASGHDGRAADARTETGAHDSSTHDSSTPESSTRDSGSDAGAPEAGTDTGVADSSAHDSSVEPCGLKASCTESVDDTCVGLTSNAGLSRFGVRMAELDLTSPAGLTSGIVNTVVRGAVGLDLPACNLNGTAGFSWLLQFDTTAMTLKTGGARPVSDPTAGYSFDDEMITLGPTTFHVQPTTYLGVVPDPAGTFQVAMGMDLLVPIFLDTTGTSSLLLPLHEVVLSGTLSSHDDCIGSYNATGLQPTNDCNPDSTHPSFIDAATVSGFISLADADSVIVTATNESLCVILAGDATMYGTVNAAGVTVCKRDASNDIVYQGHWCSTTNMAATASCADAEQLLGSFAASSVEILN